ncbi:flagellar biosynthetic protein FliR [Buchnera aphidicola (Ceratoglyphina bambusae)]|uniref:flagellar biosynthetic protein FliR n=1 Tax=Buchnera aphidicola TaxID=9 RepID=UPI0031B884BB
MIYLNLYKIIEVFNETVFVLARVLSLIVCIPIFGEKFLNKKIKILFSIFISFLYSSFFYQDNYISIFSSIGFLIFLEQIIIGIFLGFLIQLIFSIPIIIGEIISLQIGLSLSTVFDITQKWNSSVFSYFIKIFILMIFFSNNGHFWIIYIIFNSFKYIPIKSFYFSKDIFFSTLSFFSKVFYSGVILVIPIIIIILILNIMMFFLNKAIPQFSVFSIFLPALLLIGLLILYYYIPINLNNFCNLLQNMFEQINNFQKNIIIY